jgi:hypothetical protein
MLFVKSMPLQSLEDVQAALQYAIELEHATIPPYLTALYSIKDGANQAIAAILRGIVMQEMQHMAISANILNAIGGAPEIDTPKFVPRYPGGLPFHIGDRNGKSFSVGLKRLSLETVRDTFMRIEEPDAPLDIPVHAQGLALPPGFTFRTIGDFYRAVQAALKAEWFTGDPSRQVDFGARIASLADARNAIDLIVSEGEGTTASPSDGRNIAHYYRFEEIDKQLTLRPDPTSPVKYSFGPPRIPFDPAGVWPTFDNPTSASYPAGSPAHMRSEPFQSQLHRSAEGAACHVQRQSRRARRCRRADEGRRTTSHRPGANPYRPRRERLPMLRICGLGLAGRDDAAATRLQRGGPDAGLARGGHAAPAVSRRRLQYPRLLDRAGGFARGADAQARRVPTVLVRLAKDFETTIASATAWVFVAHIRTLTRRIART